MPTRKGLWDKSTNKHPWSLFYLLNFVSLCHYIKRSSVSKRLRRVLGIYLVLSDGINERIEE